MNGPLQGLSSAEVAERTSRGLVNRARRSEWADYAAIASRHLFTLFNFIVAPAALALFYHGEWQGGIAVATAAIINTVVGLFQEIRAKRQLDRLAILTQTRAHVIRDGRPSEVPVDEVVQDDCVVLRSGDAVVADGAVLDAKFLEVDEALLTGESDPVQKHAGDLLLSGSVCVAGEAIYRAERVGAQAFAQSISTEARRFHYAHSPMTRIINQIITILSVTAVALCVLYFTLYYLHVVTSDRLVLMIAATITSMVPQGLVLTATVSFTIGAVVMSRRGALVQRLNAVEAMAAVDVICTDKTGTLTTNRLRLERVVALTADVPEPEARRRLALFASASVDQQNHTIQALRQALGDAPAEALEQIPFKSQNRFSAVRLATAAGKQVLALGAPEALATTLGEWDNQLRELRQAGLRVLLFAEAPPELAATIDFAKGELPRPLRLLALVALADELRPGAADVIRALSAQGIAFKVISGDNPETVRATIAPLDLPLAHEAVVTGQDVEAAQDLRAFVEKHSVFGRVEPRQKLRIVEALRSAGHDVAMIGDGVNDVLPIKRSDLGIAMGEGSQAAKTVSGLVLEKNDFAMLPETIEEGRTIVRNLRRAAKLFLVKNVYSFILILVFASGLFGLPFPYQPQQVTLLNWSVIGIPAFLIALTRERSRRATRTPFLRDVGWFAVRTGVLFALAGIVIMAFAKHACDCDEKTQRTMLLSVLILLGITALHRVLSEGCDEMLVADKRLTWFALAVIPVYFVAMYWPVSARFFQLTMLSALEWLEVLAVVAPTYALSRFSDRWSVHA
jgi:cation-transporting P-type ATPase E